MAKKKVVEKQEVSRFELPGGAIIVKYDDGSIQITPAPIELTAEDAASIFGEESDDEEEEEDEEEDEVSIEDMKEALLESGVTKKELKKMSDEEIEEAYNDLDSEEEDEDDESDEEEEDEESDDEEEEEDEELTPEALAGMDFEELESVCDDKDLDTDPDEFEEEDIEKLRKAIAKELKITLPSSDKKKKKK